MGRCRVLSFTAVANEPSIARAGLPRPLADVLELQLPLGDPGGATKGLIKGTLEPELLARTLAVLGIKRAREGANLEPIIDVLEAGRGAGLDRDTLFAAAQAYGRGVGRIIDAEVELTRLLVRATVPENRARTLDALLASIVPLAYRLFDALHTLQLRDGLALALSDAAIDEPAVSVRAVALVDLVDSTGFLASATPAETERLVDSLCAAATACVANREVVIAKYLGDGFIIVARDPDEVAGAAIDAVQTLARSCPRLPARAGLAAGPLTRRAGDYFGFAVNKAQRLASLALPHTVLVDVAVELTRSPEVLTRPRLCRLRGLAEPVACLELSLRDAAAA
jgi:class 3 adenylate cyclase